MLSTAKVGHLGTGADRRQHLRRALRLDPAAGPGGELRPPAVRLSGQPAAQPDRGAGADRATWGALRARALRGSSEAVAAARTARLQPARVRLRDRLLAGRSARTPERRAIRSVGAPRAGVLAEAVDAQRSLDNIQTDRRCGCSPNASVVTLLAWALWWCSLASAGAVPNGSRRRSPSCMASRRKSSTSRWAVGTGRAGSFALTRTLRRSLSYLKSRRTSSASPGATTTSKRDGRCSQHFQCWPPGSLTVSESFTSHDTPCRRLYLSCRTTPGPADRRTR